MFRKSLDDAEIPDEWRDAHVTPIFKKGTKADPGNYRPVNQVSGFCKVFERRVKEGIDTHTDENNIINNSQHGFISGLSTLSQILAHFDKILKCLEGGEDVKVVYLDFAKAFDKVDFSVILKS